MSATADSYKKLLKASLLCVHTDQIECMRLGNLDAT